MAENDERAITNLIASYAELVDAGDFAGVGELLAHASFGSGEGSLTGADAIAEMFGKSVITYDDGTPRTKHVTTNIHLEIDGASAAVRSYFTVLQAVTGLSLQPIIAGRYRDRFTRTADGWQFAERVVTIDLIGDVSGHLRGTRPAPVTD
ncbi:nuclear transport factor 2 family protein [Williamsia muralis]|uniref:Nuclear transport factor 2 family protein n=1 Tax=Williamsia marianensis TaxID=85044 RepID=A0ABU4ERC5_WILMA|nr:MULTISPECIES: nuclear transport factor 2 family protein [Williamsia]MDV7133296.1 nuclear transport factor 2 family protein [Williamsia muralis]PVY30594.1 SnoaL-like protein [Williamsia marianensis]